MTDSPSQFKGSPKKYQPRGVPILYEDHDILVVNKMAGLLTMGTDREKNNTAYYLLTNYVRKGNSKSRKRLFIVHRLDRETSGVLVFAKTEKAKRYLQEQWEQFSKIYHVIVYGKLIQKDGLITSYLAENEGHQMYSVNDRKKGKYAKTAYKVIKESKNYSMLEVNLLTGRKNQIRVHLNEKGHAVVGDKKYGEKKQNTKRLALHALSITINHPHTKKEMKFQTAKTPDYFKALMNENIKVKDKK